MASEIEEALHTECKRLAEKVRILETEGREEFHRILDDITGQLSERDAEIDRITRERDELRAKLDSWQVLACKDANEITRLIRDNEALRSELQGFRAAWESSDKSTSFALGLVVHFDETARTLLAPTPPGDTE